MFLRIVPLLLCLLLASPPARSAAGSDGISRDGDIIRIEGRIRFVTEKRFAALLAQPGANGQARRIELHLDSEGGNLDATFGMLREMAAARRAGMRFLTRVPAGAICYSACTLLFAAGEERIAGDDASFLFHGIVHRGPDGGRTRPDRAALVAAAREKYLAGIGEADPGLARWLREREIVARNLEVTFAAGELSRIFPAYVTRIEAAEN
ncbi:MAG: hypothetical protein KIT81_09630 [Alphaproteobacteria bacterium]|nr:hypothetical protein [Alphaproteobacteria bacterium]